MKFALSILVILFGCSLTNAQSESTPLKSSGVEILKFSWSKERIGWEADPFGGPLENFDEMRSRVRNEKRIDDAKRGGNSAGADQVKREARADAANLARQRERDKTRPRYVFIYKARVKNNGRAPIKTIDWDYVFLDRATQEELGRQQFTSDEVIAPGKAKELTVMISTPPTRTISVTSLNKGEEDQLIEKVVLVRVQYYDGTIWQIP